MAVHFDKGQAFLASLSDSPGRSFGIPDLVIFDFDGVIADSELISLASLQTALHDFGVQLELPEVQRRFLGKSVGQIKTEANTLNPNGIWDGFDKHWYSVLFDRFEKELASLPGVVSLLDRLDELGLPYCIASSGSLKRINFALNIIGLTSRFRHVFSSEQVNQGKPAPDLFLHAANTLGAKPERCIVIEDSAFGIQAGRSAGMHTIGFLGGAHLEGLEGSHRNLLLEQGAHDIIYALDEITFSSPRRMS